jgi:Chemotaxis protein histidine kinase and related kinases
MSVELDNELLNVFLIEARELLETLGEQLVDLEASPEDSELLNAVFRAFHTVKGGAGFLGLNPMVELCHRAEDLLNEARNGALVLNAALMDALLESLDLLNDMMRGADSGVPIEPAPRSLLDRLLIPGRAASAAPVALAVPVSAPKAATPAPAGAAKPYDPIEDEFEAMLDAARSERAPAPEPSGTISDDEFEALLDSLYGTGAPGAEGDAAAPAAPAPVVAAPVEPAPVAAADSNSISDDEFEALLDQLYGTGAPQRPRDRGYRPRTPLRLMWERARERSPEAETPPTPAAQPTAAAAAPAKTGASHRKNASQPPPPTRRSAWTPTASTASSMRPVSSCWFATA